MYKKMYQRQVEKLLDQRKSVVLDETEGPRVRPCDWKSVVLDETEGPRVRPCDWV